jgi:hypothetical protein
MRPTTTRTGDEGSAFVISILVLFVLTVLGLALMLTTTTEKEISTNYRWGEQAFFNADAALEYGKNVLASYATVNANFAAILPPARGPGQPVGDIVVTPADEDDRTAKHPEGGGPCDPATAGCRDYQYYIDQCASPGVGPCNRIYIGRVLNRPDGTPAMYDFRAPAGALGDLDGDGAQDIDGTFTIWVRRPVVGTRDYGSLPNEDDRVIITAEGTAPNGLGAGTGRPVSVRRLEMSVRLPTQGIQGTEKSDSSNPDSSAEAGSNMGGVAIP